MNIREVFKDDVSKSAFKVVDGVTRIIGKYGELEIVGGIFDIYFVGPERTPLSTRRINSAEKKLENWIVLQKLNGEAYCQTDKVEIARLCLPLLGVRKKTQYSEETKEKMRERIKNIRRN